MSRMRAEQDENSPDPKGYVAESKRRMSAEKQVEYPAQVMRECSNPRNLRKLRDGNASARFTASCGDSMEIYLRIANGIVEEATYVTSGCCGSIASGSVLTRLVEGRSVKSSRCVTERDLLDALGDMPREKHHCAKLAITTLRMALDMHESSMIISKKGKQVH
jgi:nitrogen fixation NifU-like protein